MGFRVILLILAFLILFGSIIVVLSNRQIVSIGVLSSSKMKKEAQQLANSYVLDAARELKQRIVSHQAIMPPLNTTQDDYSISLHVESGTFNGHTLPSDHYYIVCQIETTDEDGITYRFRTNALYNIATAPPASPYIMPNHGITTNAQLRMALGLDSFELFHRHFIQGGGDANMPDAQPFYNFYPPLQEDRLSTIPLSAVTNVSPQNIIYFPLNALKDWPSEGAYWLNIGTAADTAPYSTPINLDYDITIISEGDIRIGSSLHPNPPHRINIISLGGTIMFNGGTQGNNAGPGHVDANLFVTPGGGIQFSTTLGWSHDANRRYTIDSTTVDGVIAELTARGFLPGDKNIMKSWEELPVEIERP